MSWLNPLTWPMEPLVILGVEVTVALYVWGGSRRTHVVQGPKKFGPPQWRTTAFVIGLAVILLSLDTPIETLARQLFWAHMTQHLLLIMVAAPLLVVAAPGMQIWRGLPLSIRRPLARIAVKHPAMRPVRRLFWLATGPVAAWLLSSGNLWLWHWPVAYDLTLRNHAIHHVEHVLFLGLGILFWAQVIDQPPFRCRMSQVKRVAYVFLAAVQAWALAILLGYASAPYYAYAQLPWRPGGISALTDQQLGAGIMWVPGSITYAILIIVCTYFWLRDEDRAAQRVVRRSEPVVK
jgi:putative membrane protein